MAGSRSPGRAPVYKAYEVRDGKLLVGFTEETRRGLRLDQDDTVGFYIAGDDREFHHPRVRVIWEENVEKLVVWSDDVEQPVAVRYAWSNLPVGRLMNHLELPAYPFRTGDWPLTPHQSTGDYHRGTQK